VPWQLFGNGRNDWSAKLVRGLSAEAAAGFQSRRRRSREPTPVNPHYAAFATYPALFRSVSRRGLGLFKKEMKNVGIEMALSASKAIDEIGPGSILTTETADVHEPRLLHQGDHLLGLEQAQERFANTRWPL
jgi:hypothetical protein